MYCGNVLCVNIVNLVVVDGYNDYHYIIGVYLIKKEVNVDF